jgi:aspartyl protease family protein
MLAILLLILVGLIALFWGLDGDPGAMATLAGDNIGYIVGALALLALYLAAVSGDYRGRRRVALRHAATWLAIGLALVVAYTYRAELGSIVNRVAGEVLPPGHTIMMETTAGGEQAVRLRRQENGHFLARGAANGVSLMMLVDTGASTVVLKPADAERVGIDTSNLSFTTPVQTANGTAFAAPVRLKSVSVGPLEIRDVEALVATPGALSENLLGISFLKRLRSYEFSGDFLTLRG